MKIIALHLCFIFLVNAGLAQRYPRPNHTPITNGCGPDGILNNIPDFSFGDACNKHDICYGTCFKLKEHCDLDFLNDMLSSCPVLSPFIASCRALALVYYEAVVLAAKAAEAYEDSQKSGCIECSEVLSFPPPAIIPYCSDESPTFELRPVISPNIQNYDLLWSTGQTGASITLTPLNANASVSIVSRDLPNGPLITCSAYTTVIFGIKNNCDNPDNAWEIPIISSADPNDIIGPEGYGPGKMIARSRQHSYMIRFENDPNFATAPAQIVKINHPLDNNVNPFSLRLGDFGFAGMTFTVPPDRTYYTARLNLVDSLGVVVDVTAGIDAVKKEAFWIFESKDPATGLPPTIASLGFLPVNDSTAKGEGFVTYLIKAANYTQTGDSIHAKASIVFDANSAIETPAIFNTIDAVAPVSHVKALPAIVDSTAITVSWNGQDDTGGSGVRDYNLYVSENSAPFKIYQAGIQDTTTRFTGTRGSTYCFFTLANDNVGNQEPMKNGCEAMLQISQGIILPVQWLYFKGQQANKDVLLNWATIMEKNTKNFVIERSFNGSQFTLIGTVTAKGNSTQTSNYNYTDKEAAALHVKVVYYRLRQVDMDGTFTYSIILAIPLQQNNVELMVQAFPNPFKQTITLQILNVTATKENDHVSLYALDGKQLYSRKLSVQGNATVLLQDIPDLKQGVYLLKTSINEKLFTIKMIRQ